MNVIILSQEHSGPFFISPNLVFNSLEMLQAEYVEATGS